MLDPTDTIAAVASPPGPGFRGLVRLTGPEAWAIALAAFDRRPRRPASPVRAERAHGRGWRWMASRPALPASIALWPGPRTYTGQPLAEIHTVGSPPLVDLVLAHCLTRGARLAEPGEFTLRAFLSGRIDLTRAEAVLGVIDARTPAQLDAALEQLAGGLAGPIAASATACSMSWPTWKRTSISPTSPTSIHSARAALAESLSDAAAEVAALAERLRGRDRPEGHPLVVLVGPPNAGKSRLFNALLGRVPRLVSPLAGTTRDYLSALCDCDGLTVELIDTAGLEPAADRDRRPGPELPRRCRPTAPTCCSTAGPPTTRSLPPIAPDRPRLRVWTKSDLTRRRRPEPNTSPPAPRPARASTPSARRSPRPSAPGRRRRPSRGHRRPLPREPRPRQPVAPVGRRDPRPRRRRRARRHRPPPGPRRAGQGRRRRRHRRHPRPHLPAVLHREMKRGRDAGGVNRPGIACTSVLGLVSCLYWFLSPGRSRLPTSEDSGSSHQNNPWTLSKGVSR